MKRYFLGLPLLNVIMILIWFVFGPIEKKLLVGDESIAGPIPIGTTGYIVISMIAGGFFVCAFVLGLRFTRKGNFKLRKILLFTALTFFLIEAAYLILSFFAYTNYTHDLLADIAIIGIEQSVGFFLGGLSRWLSMKNKVKKPSKT